MDKTNKVILQIFYKKTKGKKMIRKETMLNSSQTQNYEFSVNTKEELLRIILYITTMCENWYISVNTENKKFMIERYGKINGYITVDRKINEKEIKKWYDEIEGGENNMHETIN